MSSSSEAEKERKKELQEAISGVDLPSTSFLPSAKKQKLSKRIIEQDDTSGSLVTAETRKFIAKKLGHLLDEQYEVSTCADSPSQPPSTLVSCIKLLSDSTQPISLTQPPLKQVRRRTPKVQATDFSDTSSESETENLRLREAAIDPRTLIGNH